MHWWRDLSEPEMNITELRLVEKVNLNIYAKIDFLHYPNRNHPGRIVHSLNDRRKKKKKQPPTNKNNSVGILFLDLNL